MRKIGKPREYWALYNGYTLWAVERTQQELKRYAEESTGEPWANSKEYLSLVKVHVVPVNTNN